jgi:hypothetical protein
MFRVSTNEVDIPIQSFSPRQRKALVAPTISPKSADFGLYGSLIEWIRLQE